MASSLEAAEKAVNKFVSRRLQPAVKKARDVAVSSASNQGLPALTRQTACSMPHCRWRSRGTCGAMPDAASGLERSGSVCRSDAMQQLAERERLSTHLVHGMAGAGHASAAVGSWISDGGWLCGRAVVTPEWHSPQGTPFLGQPCGRAAAQPALAARRPRCPGKHHQQPVAQHGLPRQATHRGQQGGLLHMLAGSASQLGLCRQMIISTTGQAHGQRKA